MAVTHRSAEEIAAEMKKVLAEKEYCTRLAKCVALASIVAIFGAMGLITMFKEGKWGWFVVAFMFFGIGIVGVVSLLYEIIGIVKSWRNL